MPRLAWGMRYEIEIRGNVELANEILDQDA
jgi:hypothetical protein